MDSSTVLTSDQLLVNQISKTGIETSDTQEPTPLDASSKDTQNPPLKTEITSVEGVDYWRVRYEKLLVDYNRLQSINQNLEDKLLTAVESYEQKNKDIIANNEFERSTLMADVNKLSTKLVDARIKLHDYEEKELLHASECNAPCHKFHPNGKTKKQEANEQSISPMNYDPNLV